MASLPTRPQAIRTRPFWAGAVASAVMVVAVMLMGLLASGPANAQSRTADEGSAAAYHVSACDLSVAVSRPAAVDMLGNECSDDGTVPHLLSGGACCGTGCHASAAQIVAPQLYPPPAARPVPSALRLKVVAGRSDMFRPPIA